MLFHADRQRAGRTDMTKVAFRNFANAPNKDSTKGICDTVSQYGFHPTVTMNSGFVFACYC